MGFYKTPAEMHEARAKRFEKDGKRNWAKAMSGEGDSFFGKAKKCYAEAERNKKLAEEARKKKLKFGKK